MTSEEYNRPSLGALFQEIKFQLKKVVFGAVKLVVCPRSCNLATRSLAESLFGHFPEFEMDAVSGDLASMNFVNQSRCKKI